MVFLKPIQGDRSAEIALPVFGACTAAIRTHFWENVPERILDLVRLAAMMHPQTLYDVLGQRGAVRQNVSVRRKYRRKRNFFQRHTAVERSVPDCRNAVGDINLLDAAVCKCDGGDFFRSVRHGIGTVPPCGKCDQCLQIFCENHTVNGGVCRVFFGYAEFLHCRKSRSREIRAVVRKKDGGDRGDRRPLPDVGLLRRLRAAAEQNGARHSGADQNAG